MLSSGNIIPNKVPSMRTKLVFLFAATLICPAAADAIDGDWCGPEGKRLNIKGPEIITPGGITMQGEYGRHEFIYVAPKEDKDAGKQVFLRLISEEEMNFYHVTGESLSAPELWKRCQITS
jgi:hypothetical protein